METVDAAHDPRDCFQAANGLNVLALLVMDLTFVVQSKQGQKIDGILCAGTEDAFRMPTVAL
jgi:hypothetical protein